MPALTDQRNHEKRWYQKPDFLWMIGTFFLLQGAQMWRASNIAASKSAVQVQAFDNLAKSVDEFQRSIVRRLDDSDKRQESWQGEQRHVWQQEHDSNGELKGKYDQLKSELDEFKADYKREKSTADQLVGNARERIGKLEVRP